MGPDIYSQYEASGEFLVYIRYDRHLVLGLTIAEYFQFQPHVT